MTWSEFSICFAKCCSASHRFTKVYVLKPGRDAPKEYVDVLSRGFDVERSGHLNQEIDRLRGRCEGRRCFPKGCEPWPDWHHHRCASREHFAGDDHVPDGFASEGQGEAQIGGSRAQAHVNDVQLFVAQRQPRNPRRKTRKKRRERALPTPQVPFFFSKRDKMRQTSSRSGTPARHCTENLPPRARCLRPRQRL